MGRSFVASVVGHAALAVLLVLLSSFGRELPSEENPITVEIVTELADPQPSPLAPKAPPAQTAPLPSRQAAAPAPPPPPKVEQTPEPKPAASASASAQGRASTTRRHPHPRRPSRRRRPNPCRRPSRRRSSRPLRPRRPNRSSPSRAGEAGRGAQAQARETGRGGQDRAQAGKAAGPARPQAAGQRLRRLAAQRRADSTSASRHPTSATARAPAAAAGGTEPAGQGAGRADQPLTARGDVSASRSRPAGTSRSRPRGSGACASSSTSSWVRTVASSPWCRWTRPAWPTIPSFAPSPRAPCAPSAPARRSSCHRSPSGMAEHHLQLRPVAAGRMSGIGTTRRCALAGAAAFSAAVALGPAALAQLRVDITKGVVQPVPIAVSPFSGDSPAAQDRGAAIAQVISADLDALRPVRVLDRGGYIRPPDDARPARASRTGARSTRRPWSPAPWPEPQVGLAVEFRLWDVFAGEQLRGVRFDRPTASGAGSPTRSPTPSTSG